MAIIPDHLRPALRAALDDLVTGRQPELLTWVRAYGTDGALLVRQPEDIWTHRDSEALDCPDTPRSIERRPNGKGPAARTRRGLPGVRPGQTRPGLT